MFLNGLKRAAALLACLLAFGGAQADTVTITGFLGGRSAGVDLDTPRNGNFSAGEFTGLWNGNSFSAMCVDVNHDLSFGTTYTNYTAMTPAAYGFTATQVGLFNRLYTDYYATSHTNGVNAAAFQIAVWEITYDGNGALNHGADTFTLGAGGNATAKSTAASWLSTLTPLASSAWTFTVLDSQSVTGGQSATQDLLVAIPVPEPETYALLLAGLGLLGFVARHRKA
jgi:hypothetical protein